MRRKVILSSLILGILGIVGWLFTKSYQGVQSRQKAVKAIQTLPAVSMRALDSTVVQLAIKRGQPTVIFFFDPHCEHCQSEAEAIKKQAGAFASTRLVWLSTEQLWLLRQFDQKYQLTNAFPTLQIAQISPQVAYEQLGFRGVPTILIYDGAGQLTKKFTGQTKIEAITKSLPFKK